MSDESYVRIHLEATAYLYGTSEKNIRTMYMYIEYLLIKLPKIVEKIIHVTILWRSTVGASYLSRNYFQE